MTAPAPAGVSLVLRPRPTWAPSQHRAAVKLLGRLAADAAAVPDVAELVAVEAERLRCRPVDVREDVRTRFYAARADAIEAAAAVFGARCKAVGLDPVDVLAWRDGR